MTARRAFTLIELLVVVAIVAILAAILFPVFARAKESARAATCLSNMRQLGTAFVVYGGDADDLLPFSGDYQTIGTEQGAWVPDGHLPSMPSCARMVYGYLDLCTVADVQRGSLWPYVKNKAVYRCPSDQTGRFVGTGQAVDSSTQWVTYGMDYFVSGRAPSSMAFPAATDLLVDEDVTTRNNGSFWPCNPEDPTEPTCPLLNDEFGRQHAQGANLLFCDAHAKRRPRGDFDANSTAHRIWFPDRLTE